LIPNLIKNEYQPPLSTSLVSEAHLLEDSEEIRHSYIIAVSALERIMSELVNSKMKSFTKILTQLIESKNKTKLIVVAGLLGVPTDDLNKAIDAIDIRNKIIHEGILDDKNHYDILHGLFRTISLINQSLGGPKCKFPPLNKRFEQGFRIT
jgi:hypothetical protein